MISLNKVLFVSFDQSYTSISSFLEELVPESLIFEAAKIVNWWGLW